MADFVAPKRLELDVTDAIKALYGDKVVLVKDLQEGQVICGQCNGLGLQKNDFRFGIPGDPARDHFPYHEQVFGPCGACYTGVQTLCEYCRKPWPKSVLRCECEAADGVRRDEAHDKEEERKKRCTRVAYKDYKGECMYDEDAEAYIYDGADEDLESSHTYYACIASKDWVGIDKSDLLDRLKERADEECEDGSDMVDWDPAAEKKLEELLAAWFKEHVKLSETYWPDRSTIVVVTPQDCGVTWDEDGDEYEDGAEAKLFECAEESCSLLLHPDKVGEAPQRCKKHKEDACAPSL